MCRSGRGWRRFAVVRPAGRGSVVLCGGCRARFGDDPPVGRRPAPALEPVLATAEPLASAAPRPGGRGTDRPDRLRAALRKLPGSFSTAMAARAAGLSSEKALARLQDLERRGESDASANAGRPSRRRAMSPQPWIGFRRGRATFGSCGNARGSADQPRRVVPAAALSVRSASLRQQSAGVSAGVWGRRAGPRPLTPSGLLPQLRGSALEAFRRRGRVPSWQSERHATRRRPSRCRRA